ncbi:tetratricopeptide repeat protein [Streptomyces viridiviolaceus]
MIAHHEEQLAAFADALNQLHIACGAPPHSTISKNARSANRCPLPASSLSEVFAGKRLPKLEFLIELIRHLRPGDRQLLDEWRGRWSAAKQAERRALPARKRQKASAATPSAPPVPVTALAPSSSEEPDERLASAEQRAEAAEERAETAERRAAAAELRAAQAEDAARRAAQQSENGRGTGRRQAVDAAYSLACVYETQGRLDEAEMMYHRALDSGHPDAAYSLGSLYEQRGRLDEAEMMYHRALESGS